LGQDQQQMPQTSAMQTVVCNTKFYPMNIISFSILTAIFGFNLTSFSQTPISMSKKFVETKPPKVGSQDWFSLNYSLNEFGVKNVSGKLEIQKAKEKHRCDLKLPEGTLIAIDHGEFGGTLTFTPLDSTKKEVRIKEGNIKFIFAYRSKIYFIEGLAHGGYSEGTMYELDTVGQSFIYKKILDFEDAPEAFAIYGDKFLIATHENFYVIKNFQKELIFKETFWSSLYPNSIAAFDEANIFVGMRGGIVKIDLITKLFKFYKNVK